MKWPTDKFLQYLITWFVTGWCWQVLFSQPPQTTTMGEAVQQWLGMFFVNLVSPMMFGAICSEFPLISWSAFACGAAFIGTLTVGPIRSAYAAKYAMAAYFLLSMFTLWVEPWMTFTGAMVILVEILLKVSTTIVNVGISLLAMVILRRTALHVDVELSK
jgi:hypothetical protein